MSSEIYFTRHFMLFLAAVAGLLNVLPLILFFPNGDVVLSYALIQCFGEQVWTGHLYPRWCMNANAGYGSPGPIFYFPLPFYITSIFFPLRFFDVEIRTIYLIAVWFLSAVSFITTTLWLRIYTSQTKAAICAFIFLFISYRMEVLVFRSSYAEAWAIGLMPLLFIQIRKLIEEKQTNWPQLALVITILLFTHAPATLIGLMASGILVLAHNPKKLVTLGVSTILAFITTLFHWKAAEMFSDTLHPIIGGLSYWKTGWVNNFADEVYSNLPHYINATDHDNFMKLAAITSISMGVIFLFSFWLCHESRLKDKRVRKEAFTWLFIMLLALFMMFSPSQFLWQIIELASKVKTPWRMGMLVAFGFAVLLAMASEHVWDGLSKLHKKLTALVLASLMIMGVGLMHFTRTDMQIQALDVVIYTQNIMGYFNTRWMDTKYLKNGNEEFFTRYVIQKPSDRAHFADHNGSADIKSWFYDGINMHTTRKKPGTLIIEQFYNPVWYATINGKPAQIEVENGEIGRMQLQVPTGESDITLTIDTEKALPASYTWICRLSLIGFLIIVAGYSTLHVIRKRRQPSNA